MQRWVIDVQPNLAVTVLVNIPGNCKPVEKRPAILCWHRRSHFSKDEVMGDRRSEELDGEVRRCNYDHGLSDGPGWVCHLRNRQKDVVIRISHTDTARRE